MKNRVIASGQLLLRFDQGDAGPVDPEMERALIAHLERLYGGADAVVISDYGYGVVTEKVKRAVTRLQARSPRVLAVDAKDLLKYRGMGVTTVKPNYAEAVRLLGVEGTERTAGRAERIAAEGGRILDLLGCEMAAVTLDSDGAVVFERGAPPFRTYAKAGKAVSATGAGDTFLSALALALAAGAHTPAAAELASAAVEIASAASAVVVSKNGTSTCSLDELVEYVAAYDKRVDDLHRLAARVEARRQQGQRVVFTNGCFDILHRGHVTYLSRAKALGDVLIVAVNSDESVRQLKGAERPINPLDDRLQVLAALSCVDFLVPFDDETPERVIRAVRPDVFVKGGDYTRETLPEARVVEELGGVVQILPYVEDHSTTSIIHRIRGTYVSSNAA